MSVFLLADVKVTNDQWVPDYAAHVHEIVARHSGTYLSRSGNITTLEGAEKDSTIVAILQFPTREALDGFANDPEYAPYAASRQGGSVSSFYVIDDTDLVGTIPYLAAG